ncbi:MAG: hypothetical protein [Bacteriophage sp.]|nr:MAG: hypothetical protein [Bacteriophage sp.]
MHYKNIQGTNVTNKTIISHHKLSDMLGNMTELQALTTLSRMRAQADRDGLCVTRIIVGGKVQEQTVWKR